MSLAEQLDTIRAGAAARIPPEQWAIMTGATTALRESGILAIFVTKHAHELRHLPGLHGRLYRWMQGTARNT